MSDNEQIVKCEEHGEGVAAAICGHLVQYHGPPLGFIENSSDPTDLQGWCYACEHLFDQEGEMTEKFLKIHELSIVCSQCYSRIKAANEITT